MVNSELDNLYDNLWHKVKNAAIGILVIIVILLLMTQCEKDRTWKANQDALVSVYTDSLKTWKDKDGSNMARISVLETSSEKDFLAIKTQKEEIIRLQKLVKNNNLGTNGSATVLTTQGSYSTSVKPTITFPKSVLPEKQPCDTIYPIYEAPFGDEWVHGVVRATSDSIDVGFKYRDMFDLVIGEEKSGFLGLGKPKPFADVKSYNPYTEIKEYRTYRVKDKPAKKFGIGPVAAYGFGTGTFTPQFFIGIGGSFNLIRF